MKALLVLISLIVTTQSGQFTDQQFEYYASYADEISSSFMKLYDELPTPPWQIYEEAYKKAEFPYKNVYAVDEIRTQLAKVVPISEKLPPECEVVNSDDLVVVYNETFVSLGKTLYSAREEYRETLLKPIEEKLKSEFTEFVAPLREKYQKTDKESEKQKYLFKLVPFVNKIKEKLAAVRQEVLNYKEQLEMNVKIFVDWKKEIEEKLAKCEEFIEWKRKGNTANVSVNVTESSKNYTELT